MVDLGGIQRGESQITEFASGAGNVNQERWVGTRLLLKQLDDFLTRATSSQSTDLPPTFEKIIYFFAEKLKNFLNLFFDKILLWNNLMEESDWDCWAPIGSGRLGCDSNLC